MSKPDVRGQAAYYNSRSAMDPVFEESTMLKLETTSRQYVDLELGSHSVKEPYPLLLYVPA